MISSLRGKLVSKDTEGAVIECGGVGYGVAMSLSALSRLGELESAVRVLVHTHMTQESLRLYGFLDAVERATFELLLNTTGVGPRLALAILSTLTPSELQEAVAVADKSRLTQIPGVGPKKAERLLLELKGRIQAPTQLPEASGVRPTRVLDDLLSALVNLGFATPVAERAARQAVEDAPQEQDLAMLVRAALRSTKPVHA